MAQRQYIIMPVHGWHSARMIDFAQQRPLGLIARHAQADNVRSYGGQTAHAAAAVDGARYDLLASASEDGPKLVSMEARVAGLLRWAVPSARIEPNRRATVAARGAVRIARAADWTKRPGTRAVTVRVVDPAGQPVIGARVLAFSSLTEATGAPGHTGQKGTASFHLPEGVDSVPRLWVEPSAGFYGAALMQARIAGDTIEVTLRPIDPAAQADALRRWATGLDRNAGAGVRVAVVDTGADPAHPDLAHVGVGVADSFDLMPEPGAPPGVPHMHANHVCGIIGARGTAFRGLAPEAEVTSMRVTPLGLDACGSYNLGQGIKQAAEDGDVHLINVSMTQDLPSVYLNIAAMAAFHNGAVCIAAAGNAGRDSVAYPAMNKRFLAVTAYADRSVLADDAVELRDVGPVVSEADGTLSRAVFSNFGPDTDFIAPGVGIISCYGAAGYAMASGTSFSAPAITGLAAALLSKHHPDLLAMPKGPARAAAITQVLLTRGRTLGFKPETQGIGILDA